MRCEHACACIHFSLWSLVSNIALKSFFNSGIDRKNSGFAIALFIKESNITAKRFFGSLLAIKQICESVSGYSSPQDIGSTGKSQVCVGPIDLKQHGFSMIVDIPTFCFGWHLDDIMTTISSKYFCN